MTYVDFLKNEVLLIHWQHSGYANMNTKRNLFCIDDLKNGAALFRLCEDKVIAMRKFSVPETQTNIRARGVDFTTEDENIVMVVITVESMFLTCGVEKSFVDWMRAVV